MQAQQSKPVFTLTAERRKHIIETLRQEGKVVAKDLSREFGVSEDTLRRDLRELADAGLLQRVHGGALPKSQNPPDFSVRETQASAAKQAVARAAVRLVKNGQVIILDGGTTTLEVARHFPLDLQATVVTNSLHVALALSEYSGIELFLVGGKFFRRSIVTIGPSSVDGFRQFRADLCILGICAIHPEFGITVPDHDEAQVKRAMIEVAADVAAVATAEKLGTSVTHLVAPVKELSFLITDSSVPPKSLKPYQVAGITVIRAE